MEQGAMRLKRWKRLGAVLGCATLAVLAGRPVFGQTPIDQATVKASATGTVVHADLLRSGDIRLVDAEVGFSGAAYNSDGLSGSYMNEVDRAFTSAPAGKTASARGSAVEVGLAVTPADDNQIILAGKAEASSGPASSDSEEIGPVDLAPLAWANLLRGAAVANSKKDECGLGSDLSRGAAYVADVQLLDSGMGSASSASSSSTPSTNEPSPVKEAIEGVAEPVTGLLKSVVNNPTSVPEVTMPDPKLALAVPTASASAEDDDEGLTSPVVALDASDPDRAVSQSRSRTLMVAQRGKDGELLGPDFGVMSEVRQTIAPVTLFEDTDFEVTIEALGEWVLQAVATGEDGGAYVHYGPGDVSPSTPVLRLIDAAGVNTLLTLQDLLGNEGLVVEIPGVAEIAIGEDPRAIGGNADSAPQVASDGTSASAAVDVVRVKVLPGAPAEVADVRVGHMEVSASVPDGGVSCPIPVKKTPSVESANVGDSFDMTFEITNPYDCVLTDVSLTDEITTNDDARFEITSTDPAADATSGSSLSSGEITWSDIDDIAPGETVTLTATFEAQGGAGAIIDEATASAKLTDCADEGASVGGVDVSVVDAAIDGTSGEVTVPVGGGEVLSKVIERGEIPVTGAPIAQMFLLALGLLGLGGAALTLAYRMK